MGTGAVLSKTDIVRRLKKEVSEVVLVALDHGWRARALGHGVKLFCPCKQPDHGAFSVGGTPASPSREARRIRKLLSKCPKFTFREP